MPSPLRALLSSDATLREAAEILRERGYSVTQPMTRFGQMLTRAVALRMRQIMARREALVEAWMAETGLLPSESELVERHMDDGSLRILVERKEAPKGPDDE